MNTSWHLIAASVVAASLLVSCSADSAEPALSFRDAQLPSNDGQAEAVLYLRIDNDGGGDRLVAASSPRADEVSMHRADLDDGMVSMVPVDDLEIPDGGVVMASGTTHLMLEGIDPKLSVGEQVTVTLDFERSEDQELEVEVTTYEDAVDFLEGTS